MPHPSLRSFLHWLQQCQYGVQCRGIQLAAGKPPKPRSPVYVDLDKKIAQAKLNYSMNIGQLFAYILPNEQPNWNAFELYTLEYFSYISHLIGV